MTYRGRHAPAHLPVLLEEVLTWLDPKPGGRYCDGDRGSRADTPARSWSGRRPTARLIGIDRDPDALEAVSRRAAAVRRPGHAGPRPVLASARGARSAGGWCRSTASWSTSASRRRSSTAPSAGFPSGTTDRSTCGWTPPPGETAADLLRRMDEEELAQIIRDYGEERHAARVASAIVEARRAGDLDTTGKLAALVARAIPRHEYGKNPATRTFQALRIAVNEELAELEQFSVGGGRLPAPRRPAVRHRLPFAGGSDRQAAAAGAGRIARRRRARRRCGS